MLSNENIQDIYRLSPLQEGMYFHALDAGSSSAYFEQVTFRITGPLDPDRAKRCLQDLVNRHAVLRTVFNHEKAAVPLQVVLKKRDVDFSYEDLRAVDAAARIEAFKVHDRSIPFDLNHDRLMRVKVFRTEEAVYEFIWSFHHILMDGWSMGILISEYFGLYLSGQEDAVKALPPVFPYRNYVKWLEKQDLDAGRSFWEAYLAGFSQHTSPEAIRKLSFDDGVGHEATRFRHVLSRESTQGLEGLASRLGVTLNNVVQVLWGVVLAKFNQQWDCVFGTVASGRPSELGHAESMVGLFINTIPLRLQLDPEASFQDNLIAARDNLAEVLNWQYFPLHEVQTLSPLRDKLFDHLLVYENYPIGKRVEGQEMRPDFQVEGLDLFEETGYDFNLLIGPGEQLSITVLYNALAYAETGVKQVLRYLDYLIEQVLADPEIRLGALRLLPPDELETRGLYFGDGGEASAYRSFRERMAATFETARKDRIALDYETTQISYGDLAVRVKAWSAHLRTAYGVGVGDIVGISMPRSAEVMVAMLAILDAGGCVAYLNPKLPAERLDFMIRESRPKVILTVESDFLPAAAEGMICPLAALPDAPDALSEGLPDPVCPPEAPSYVIYTSGSTGRPKAILQTQETLANLLDWYQPRDHLSPNSLLQFVSFSFDVTFQDLFILLAGGTMYICSEEERSDFHLLGEKVVSRKIEGLSIPCAVLSTFFQVLGADGLSGHSIQEISSSGEQMRVGQELRDFLEQNPGLRLINNCGPAENHTAMTYPMSVAKGNVVSRPPIGFPGPGCVVLVLNDEGELCAPGERGELWIGGHQVARGYIGKPELNQQRFVSHTFSDGRSLPGFLTGDIGRWDPEGRMSLLGRRDRQVKIRGMRVEPGELERVLLGHPTVQQAYVLVAGGGEGPASLVAYVSGEGAEEAQLLAHLERLLPDYMVPSALIVLDVFPLTENGKTDVSALPAPTLRTESHTYVAPRNSVEEQLAGIYTQVLQVERAGVKAHFFRLGGHSLTATRAISLIYKAFNTRLEIRTLFEHPVLEDLAKVIQERGKDPFAGIVPVEPADHYPISHAQRRLWIIDQFESEQIAYNMPGAWVFKGSVDVAALEQALLKLIARHEILRTGIIMVDGEPRQRVLPFDSLDFKVDTFDLRNEADPWGRAHSLAIEEAEKHFDLSEAPLIRARLLQVEDAAAVYLMTLHHIISDGWSMKVLIYELIQFYASVRQGIQPELAPLNVQYKDYAAWQHALLSGADIQRHRDYWHGQFKDGVPVLDLPTDYPRPAMQSFNGNHIGHQFDPELTAALKQLALDQKASLYMVLLASVYVLLYRYSGQEDIVIGSPVAGRDHPDLESQIGFYVNTLALRNRFRREDSFAQLLHRVKKLTLDAFAHQLYPFDRLVDELNLKRDMSRPPMFDINVVLQNTDLEVGDPEAQTRALGEVEVSIFEKDFETSKFDMIFDFNETEEGLYLYTEYNSDLFREGTISLMLGHFASLLRSLVQNPDLPLDDLRMASEQEAQRLRGLGTGADALPAFQPVPALIAQQAAARPEAVALVSGDQQLTYAEMMARAGRVRDLLRRELSGGASRIALLMDNHPDTVVAILGILEAGHAYVPLNPDQPEDRIRSILEDIQAPLLISHASHIRVVNRLLWACPALDGFFLMDTDEPEALIEESGGLLSEELWDYVGEQAEDMIMGGGWVSSYTGEHLSEAEMEEYAANAFEKVKGGLAPGQRVLEIGCASGITLFQVAPLVGTYVGTDLSSRILEKTQQEVDRRGQDNVVLQHLAAHELDQLEVEGGFDLIILNSVIQSFPGYHYLRKVIADCIALLNPEGRIFLGDLQDLDLKQDLIASLKAFRLEHLGKGYRTKTDWSKELFVSRDYLEALRVAFPEIVSVGFSEKVGTLENELTRFRFDAVLEVEKGEGMGDGMRNGAGVEDGMEMRNGIIAGEGERMGGSNGTGTEEGRGAAFEFGVVRKRQGSGVEEGVGFGSDSGVGGELDMVKKGGFSEGALANGTGNGLGADMEGTTLQAADTAYVIYTSGTSGMPKGVAVSHGNLFNYLAWANAYYFGDEQGFDFPLFTSLSFDLSITSLFSPLMRGDALHIYDRLQGVDKVLTAVLGPDSPVRAVKMTPSHVRILGHLPLTESAVSHVILGGEALEQGHVEVLRKLNPEMRIFNEYGPTETTVGCTIYEVVDAAEAGLIGLPIAGTSAFVLDAEQQLVPFGVKGELYIGGAGVARGYWQRPELNRDRFVDLKVPGLPNARFYRTGDAARFREDGLLQFLGRMDEQVKIRGFRIELGAVVHALEGMLGKGNCVVMQRSDRDGNPFLAAYVAGQASLDAEGIRAALAEGLPDYMVPAFMLPVERIPLTANGKTDWKALPDPLDPAFSGGTVDLPQTDLEALLRDIWTSVLGRPNIGIQDGFFKIGGDSIKAVQVASRMYQAGYKLEIGTIFEHLCIAEIAPHVVPLARMADQGPVSGAVPLTPIQHQFFGGMVRYRNHYNQSVMFTPPQRLSVAGVEAVFSRLFEHHDALRLQYTFEGDGVEQFNAGPDQWGLHTEVCDLRNAADPVAELERHAAGCQASLDLAAGILHRIVLYQLPDADRLLIVFHHLVMDAVSWRILFEDLNMLFQGFAAGEPVKLPAKTDGFRVWAQELHAYSQGTALKAELDFWAAMTNQPAPRLPGLASGQATGKRLFLDFELDADLTENLLTEAHVAFSTEVNDLLLTALTMSVAEAFDLPALAVMMEGHGREEILDDVDISRTVGWFTSMYPLVIQLPEEPSRERQIREVKEQLRSVPNKGIGYGILKYMSPADFKEGLHFALEPEISFNYLGQFEGDGDAGAFAVAEEGMGSMQDPREGPVFPIDVSGLVAHGKLKMRLHYPEGLYDPARMELWWRLFESQLSELIDFCLHQEETVISPSDLSWSDISIDTLDEIGSLFE